MWVMLNDAFLSIVQVKGDPETLMVRARRPGDLERVFGADVQIIETPTGRDYRYRTMQNRRTVAQIVMANVLSIDYGNFKDSVADNALHDAYLKVWTAMGTVQPGGPYGSHLGYRGLRNRSIFDDLDDGLFDMEELDEGDPAGVSQDYAGPHHRLPADGDWRNWNFCHECMNWTDPAGHCECEELTAAAAAK